MKTSILSLLIIASLSMVSCTPKQNNNKSQETHQHSAGDGHDHSKESGQSHSDHDGHNH